MIARRFLSLKSTPHFLSPGLLCFYTWNIIKRSYCLVKWLCALPPLLLFGLDGLLSGWPESSQWGKRINFLHGRRSCWRNIKRKHVGFLQKQTQQLYNWPWWLHLFLAHDQSSNSMHGEYLIFIIMSGAQEHDNLC